MKWAYLDNRFTTTKIESRPFDFGSPSMKSMDISSQIWWGLHQSGWGSGIILVVLAYLTFRDKVLDNLLNASPIKFDGQAILSLPNPTMTSHRTTMKFTE